MFKPPVLYTKGIRGTSYAAFVVRRLAGKRWSRDIRECAVHTCTLKDEQQWRVLMFYIPSAWTSSLTNSRAVSDVRHHDDHATSLVVKGHGCICTNQYQCWQVVRCALCVYYILLTSMMRAWHGNAFHIVGPLLGTQLDSPYIGPVLLSFVHLSQSGSGDLRCYDAHLTSS